MYIFYILTPGTRIYSQDTEWAIAIERQLFALKAAFFEANVALNLFQAGSCAEGMGGTKKYRRRMASIAVAQHQLKKKCATRVTIAT